VKWFKKHKIITVILVLIILGVIGGAAGGGSKTKTTSNATTTAKASNQPQTAKVGQAANDGKFAFTVNSVQCNQPSVGSDQYSTKTAQVNTAWST
jgi:flagellar basal body-associated protein FliL